MRQTIRHGVEIDTATPGEVKAIMSALVGPEVTRIRATANVVLDANGAGICSVFKVPIGTEFSARRVSLDLSTAGDPSTGNVPLNVAGKYVAYQRSGTRIEYAVPISPNAAPQVPGVQSWGEQQGPNLRNGEVFEVKAVGLTAAASLSVVLEGILRKPSPTEDR